jgi:hypothetical protein
VSGKKRTTTGEPIWTLDAGAATCSLTCSNTRAPSTGTCFGTVCQIGDAGASCQYPSGMHECNGKCQASPDC